MQISHTVHSNHIRDRRSLNTRPAELAAAKAKESPNGVVFVYYLREWVNGQIEGTANCVILSSDTINYSFLFKSSRVAEVNRYFLISLLKDRHLSKWPRPWNCAMHDKTRVGNLWERLNFRTNFVGALRAFQKERGDNFCKTLFF